MGGRRLGGRDRLRHRRRQKDGYRIEVTTYRSEAYDRTSRKPEVSYGDSIEEDLVRRDFTVNAMAVALPQKEFVDPYGGLDDLAHGAAHAGHAGGVLLRRPAADDAGRAVRRPARLRGRPRGRRRDDGHGRPHRDRLGRAGTGRAEQAAALGTPQQGLRLLVDTGLADHVLPELPALRLEIDEHHRHKDVYEHSLTVLDRAIDLEEGGPDLVLRLAALLHDVGKPRPAASRRRSGVPPPRGGRREDGQEADDRPDVRERTVKDASQLLELHLRFHGYGTGAWTDSAVRRYVPDAGPELDRLHKLTRSDCTTRNRRRAGALSPAYDGLEARIAALREREELDRIRPDLYGEEIMPILRVVPGPAIGVGAQAPARAAHGARTDGARCGRRGAQGVVGGAGLRSCFT